MVKRSLLPALVIGAIVSGVIFALHRSGILLPVEMAVSDFIMRLSAATRLVSDSWQLVLVLLLSFATAWITLESTKPKWLVLMLAVFVLELVGLSWVCGLYHVFFQSLLSVLAVICAFLAAIGFTAIARRRRSRTPAYVFANRLSQERIADLNSADVPAEGTARTYEATAVVCDIANKHELAGETEPAAFTKMAEQFIERVSAHFLEAGAYLESAGGEGVVAIFGFLGGDARQAETATRAALRLLQSFANLRANGTSDFPDGCDLHIGVSSGTMMIARMKTGQHAGMMATGEPVELARRFCIANRVYGSRVLIGPRTFELASEVVIARPIDFLSGVDIRERHEIYEPVSLAANTSSEELKRRDSFWKGVVLYREKRWGEAYGHFQKARGPAEIDDRPLQLYLHRLEPLVLHLMDDSDGR